MTNGQLLQLNNQHIAELRSFFAGFEFDDVEIFSTETVGGEAVNEFAYTADFNLALNGLRLDGIFRGKDHTHFIFTQGEDNVFYCVSYAKIGVSEERIIFKLYRR